MKPPVVLLALLLTTPPVLAQSDNSVAARAINALGIDLLHQTATADANALLSPYSIQMAMAMTCAGAAGPTRDEMVRVLHYPKDEGRVDGAFAALQSELNEVTSLTTASRLYGQVSYDFRPAYLALLKDTYQAPLELCDFIHDASGATTHINDWVARQTHDRIQNLIPARALTLDTRLVLVNAIYLKAPWETKFEKSATQPRSFHLPDGSAVRVPTMYQDVSLGYLHRDGCQVVVIPYTGADLQFVILLPDDPQGLSALEARLQPEMLAACAYLPNPEVKLYLPKFDLEPPTLSLAQALQSLGMKQAFDVPAGSANFDRMAPRRPEDYLFISDIFHKTFLKVDESTTEAAAATGVEMMDAASLPVASPPPPLEIHVDHPFLFAIQHRASGACLFLGHVTDPQRQE